MFPKYEFRDAPIYAALRKHQGNYPGRFHKHLEIMVVIHSSIRVTIDGNTYILHPGDLYVAFPNILHAIESADAETIVVLVDFEKFQNFHDILQYNYPQCPVLRAGGYPSTVIDSMKRMAELNASNVPYVQETLAGYGNAVLGELLGCLQLQKRDMDGTLLQQLQLYILQNYTKSISLDDIAHELGYSKFHISRVVSQLFGCNFRSLINSFRISLAQNLLLTTGDSIGQIATICGFKSHSSFNRVFLLQTGITPNEYRRNTESVPEKPALYE